MPYVIDFPIDPPSFPIFWIFLMDGAPSIHCVSGCSFAELSIPVFFTFIARVVLFNLCQLLDSV